MRFNDILMRFRRKKRYNYTIIFYIYHKHNNKTNKDDAKERRVQFFKRNKKTVRKA